MRRKEEESRVERERAAEEEAESRAAMEALRRQREHDREAAIVAAEVAQARRFLDSLPGEGAALDEQIARVCAICHPSDHYVVREKVQTLLKGRTHEGDRVRAVAYVPRLTKAKDGDSQPETLLVLLSSGVAFKCGGDKAFLTWQEAGRQISRTLSTKDHKEPLRFWTCWLGGHLFTSDTTDYHGSRASTMPVYWALVAREYGLT